MAVAYHRRPPHAAVASAGLICLGVVLPLCYLVVRAFDAESQQVAEMVLRSRNLTLFLNTLLLVVGVVALSALLAFPLAWLTARTALPGRRVIALAGVLPLAIPAYLMAYALLGLGGNYGATAQVFGWVAPRLSGFWGAVLVLGLCNFPYLFLNLRAALLTLDPALEEVAYSLGQNRRRVLMRVLLPQLRPAFLSGMLLIGLHALSDFAAVSLMRYDTFSAVLFSQYYSGYDPTYSAWIALMLLGMTVAFLAIEAWFLRGLRLDRAGSLTKRPHKAASLGKWTPVAYGFVAVVVGVSLVAPLASILFWMTKSGEAIMSADLMKSLLGSVKASLPAALVGTALVVPIVYLSVRMPTRLTRILERSAYIGYATPALAFALGLVFFSLRVVPALYQTFFLLVYAYTMRYLAEAVGPVRSALYQAGPRLEEAARSLGSGWFSAFWRVTFPVLRNGLFVAVAFVFLSCMKELPLTILLSPLGYRTLAVDVWDYIDNAMFAEAAPFALTILAFSAVFVGVLLTQEKRTV